MNPDDLIDDILRREGGFVDHPADRGGPTKYGITQATLAEHRGRPVSVADVRDLSEQEAREIYAERYIRRPKFDRIEYPALRALLVDAAVNHGPARAVKWLQQAAGVPDDGVIGRITLDAVHKMDGGVLYRRVLATRCRFYGRLISRDPSQAVFAEGWTNRLAEFIEGAP